MNKAIYFCFAVFLSVILYCCKSDSVTGTGINSIDTGSFQFPLNTGNSWSYTYITSVSDIQPDSIRHYLSEYPLIRTGTVTILYDTLINSVQTKCLIETLNESQGTHQSRSYMINTDSALLLYAQRNIGSFIYPPSVILSVNITKRDFIFNDSLHIYQPPIEILKYPVITGRTWGTLETVLKKYEGYELIIVGAGTFNCMKKSTVAAALPEYPYYDYYCKYGLIKKFVTFNNMLVTTEWFPEGVGTADFTHTFTVNSVNIH